MEYTKLGHTGLDISRICLDCTNFCVSECGDRTWTLDEEAPEALYGPVKAAQ